MDLSDKGSECEEMSSQTPTPDRVSSDGSNVKACVDCGTSKTPLWRGGPAGPKSLCNACGIRSRKKRRALMGVTKEEKKTKKSTSGKNVISHQSQSSNSCTSSSGDSTGKIGESLNKRFWPNSAEILPHTTVAKRDVPISPPWTRRRRRR